MQFDLESKFEEAVIQQLKDKGWNGGVLKYPTEEDLIENWRKLLSNNNMGIDSLNNIPLTRTEMQQLLDRIRELGSPFALNQFINGKTTSIKRDNKKDMLHYGKEVSLKIYDRKEIAGGTSVYQIAQQPRFSVHDSIYPKRRGDLMLLINGMPVIHIELKKSGVPVSQATTQIQKYSHENVFSGLFSMVQVFVAMTPEETVYFANPGKNPFDSRYFFRWAGFQNVPINDWKKVIGALLNIPMAHELIGYFTVADKTDGLLKVLRSYQIFAAQSILKQVIEADWEVGNHSHGGYIFATTGSGKSMTSFKAAQLVASTKRADKVIFLLDRIELGNQSLDNYRNFASADEEIQNTENTNILIQKLRSSNAEDMLIVTSIQKMSRIHAEGLNQTDIDKINKKKIVVIVDECHRSTFGEMLLRIRNTFSNAMFIGFTGTPILDENSKDSITTKDIFGNELHEYTIADGIRDGNVLGFDCTKVITLKEDDVRVAVALHKAKAKSVEEVNENKNKKKIFDEWYGKDIEKLEDHLPRSQYASDEHRNAVVSDILSSWPIVSQNKYHAIFATSSILEAIAYYRLLKMKNTGLKITALFDASYDNEVNTIEKEDGLREIIIDYNAMFNKEFNLSTFPKMKKDIANRLAHKKPYLNLKKEEQIDILIVVNQMLTGYDSKWVSTLFLDKVLENEHLIQAFSRTNRPFGDQKSFGLIRFYRKPNRMEKNIQKAIKLYSGNRELEVFAPNIDSHIQEMNAQFMIIEKIFTDMPNFAHLPKAEADIAKFVKCFNILYKNMLAAQLQGFTWENKGNLLFDEQTYLVLLQRYKDVAREVSGGGGGTVDSPPYDIDINLSTQRMDRIDTEYMNERFHRYIHLLDLSETSQEELEEALNQLHQMFALLSYEQQQIAEMILLDVQSGRFKCPENITFKELITQRLMETTKGYMIKVQNAFGLNIDLLQKIMEQGNKKNLNEFGLYNKLKESIDLDKAREYFSKKTGKSISVFKINMMIDELLRKFIQEDGFDIDEIEL